MKIIQSAEFPESGVICPGKTAGTLLKHLEDPFVIIRDTSPSNYRLVRETFPASEIFEWADPKHYAKYSGKKYRAAGILYADEHIKSTKLRPERVMVYSPVGPAVEVRIEDLDKSCIVLPAKKVAKMCKILGDVARRHLFVEESPLVRNSGCMTRKKFMAGILDETVETSRGKVKCGEILKQKNPPAIIHEHPCLDLCEHAKIVGRDCILSDDAARLAIAYALIHDKAMPEKSITHDKYTMEGRDGEYIGYNDSVQILEGKQVLKISVDEYREDLDADCRVETIAGTEGSNFTNLIDMSELSKSVMAIGINSNDTWFDKVVFSSHTDRRYGEIVDMSNCDGAIYATREKITKEYGWVDLGTTYSNMWHSLYSYEKYVYGDMYMFEFGKGDGADEMEVEETCYGYHSVNDAITGAHDNGFGESNRASR